MNQYGLTLEEAEQLLQTDIITKLMSLRDMEGTAITQQLPLIDSSVVDYLNSNEVKAVLEANAKEPIQDEDLGGFEDIEIDTTFDIDDVDVGDLDLRVTDFDIQDLGGLEDVDDETEIEVSMPEKKDEAPAVIGGTKEKKKEPETIEAYKISGVDVVEFLLMLGANEVPQVDSDGSLVVKANGILMKATFVDDFGMLSTMPLNSEKVDVLFVTNNKEVDFEGARLGGKEGEFVVVDASELSPSLEEVNSVFDTQQYSVDNTEATISFDAVSTMLASIEKFDAEFSSKMVLPLGVAIDSDMTFASQFFIDPATLYELANCDTFFQASVATRNYITNYCEANDLEHLRIFELGGEHLNIPLARFIGTSISDQVIENTAFSERVNKIVTPSVQSNQKLKEVGFVPATPKGIAYNRVDSLSELAGFMVYVGEDSSEIVYIPSVVVNYFEKYYGKLQLNMGSIKAGDYRVVMFMSADSDVMQGFYLVDADKVKPAKPARLLPTNPLATQQKVRGEHPDAFTNKIDLAQYLDLEILYLGDVREQPEIEVSPLDMDIATTPSEQEGGGDAIADLRNQVALNQEAISIMTIGEDDELISELQDEIDFLESMISDLGGGTSDDEILEVQIEESFDEGDLELGEMKVGNDQEILPTPSADDPVVEDITDLEVDAIENDDYDFEVELADEPSMEADDDDEDIEIEMMDGDDFEFEDEDLVTPEPEDDIDIDLSPEMESESLINYEDLLIEKLSETRDDMDTYTIYEAEDGWAWEDFQYDVENRGFATQSEAMQDFLEYLNDNFAKGGEVKAKVEKFMATDPSEEEIEKFYMREVFPHDKRSITEIMTEEEFAKGGRPNPTKHIKVYYTEDNGYGNLESEEVIESSKNVEEVREKWKSIMISNPDIRGYQIVEVKMDGSEKKIPSKFHGFEKGGKTQSISEQVKDMTDEEVARKLTDLMYESLESFEYDMTEGEAYEYALSNIQDARNYLIDMMTSIEA